MKTISAGLETHLALESTTLATCWKVTRTDGTVYGFTSHDKDLVVSGVTYDASTGFTPTAIQTSARFDVDNLDVDGMLDSSAITEADVRAGRWDHAAVEIFEVNWADLTQGVLKHRKGRVGEIRTGRTAFIAELRGLMQFLQQTLGRLYGAACDAEVGDARCGVTLASFTVAGSVSVVSSNREFTDTSRGEQSGWFDQGKLTWTSGLNNGLAVEVKTYTLTGSPATADIALVLPMPYTVAIGDAYSMSAGCDKRFATCGSKFANKINFRGFPHLVGMDRLLSGGLP